jgi:hypothetical protein
MLPHKPPKSPAIFGPDTDAFKTAPALADQPYWMVVWGVEGSSMKQPTSLLRVTRAPAVGASKTFLARGLTGFGLCLALLTPRLASASTCVEIDAARDGLSEDERASTRTLFEEALAEAGVTVAREGCGETWTLYHVRLGESITVVVQSPRGTRRERVRQLEDLPATYHQLARSIQSGTENTNDSGNVDRRNVTEAQSDRRRVSADAIWYAKLGYGSTPAAGFHGGPAFGFGRRWELDSIGINLGFLNFIMYQDADEFSGASAGWIELGADYFFDPYANSSAYVGAGLSLGNHSIPDPDGDGAYENAGLQGKATLGYEMFRASTIRLLAHLDATLPMYRLSRTVIDPITALEDEQHVYCPTFQLSLGLGWGSHAN